MPAVQSPFDDPLLYDWEYRRRRDDVRFYRTLAGERGGPVLDLGCGTGRLMLPLLRDGHVVVGVDRVAADADPRRRPGGAPPRRAAAAGRCWSAAICGRCLSQSEGFRSPWRRFIRSSTANRTPSCCCSSGGRPPRWCPGDGWRSTRSRRPVGSSSGAGLRRRRDSAIRGSGRATIYTESHVLDGPVLAMTFRYQPVGGAGQTRPYGFIAPPPGSTPRNRSAAGPRGAQADRQLGLI